MIIQLARAIEPFGLKSLSKARIETDNICFYEKVERIIDFSPERKEEFTLIVFKGGESFFAKETPEEIDLLIKRSINEK